MKVRIDNFGRILIPKSIRRQLGLYPGVEMDINVDSKKGTVAFKPVEGDETLLKKEGDVLVYTGTVGQEAIDSTVDELRNERMDKFLK